MKSIFNIQIFLSGPCGNRTRGTTVTGWYVSHYTNGPIHFTFQSVSRFRCGLSFQLLPHFFTGLLRNNFNTLTMRVGNRGADGIRTHILFLAKEALSQLSYNPKYETTISGFY